MKKKSFTVLFIFSLLILFSSCQSARTLTDAENRYQKVIEIPDTSKDELYLMTNDWLISILNSAKSVIEYTDVEKGIIIGKMNSSLPIGAMNLPVTTNFQIKVEVKDNKARFTLSGMTMKVTVGTATATETISDMNYEKFVKWADTNLFNSYEEFIKLNKNSDSNW